MTAVTATHEDFAKSPAAARVFTPHILVVLAIYAIVEIALYWVHLPWRDEGQAWLWATTIDSFQEYFVIPGEGHPPLWFWLLKLLSLVFSFDQARFFTVVLAIANSVLLAHLLRGDFLVSVLILFSATLMLYWGYNFRPYTVVLFLSLSALLLDKGGRTHAATWLMAIACGFHFFSGFLFAFWLTFAWRRGLRVPQLAGPALLALFFAALVVFSGQSNAELNINPSAALSLSVRIFGSIFSGHTYPSMYAALIAVPLIAWMLRRDLVNMVSFFVFAALFAAFAGIVYGRYDWHAAFILMLLLMAYFVAEKPPARWPLLILLAPGMILGVFKALQEPRDHKHAVQYAYSAVVQDAGTRLKTSNNLLSWPDFILLGVAARDGFQYVSANNGRIVGPVDLSTRHQDDIDADLLTGMSTPYWLVCIDCEDILPIIEAEGLTAYELFDSVEDVNEHLGAYRIEGHSVLSGGLRPARINANN